MQGPELSPPPTQCDPGPRQQRSGSRRALRFQSFQKVLSSLWTPLGLWIEVPAEVRVWRSSRLGLLPGGASANHHSLLSAGPSDPTGQRLAADCHRHERGMYPRGPIGAHLPCWGGPGSLWNRQKEAKPGLVLEEEEREGLQNRIAAQERTRVGAGVQSSARH